MNSLAWSCVVAACVLIASVSSEEEPVAEATETKDGAAPGKEMKEEEGVYKSWQLDNTRFVKVKEYKGKLYVDIREHYEKDGQMYPGKKGILLNLAQFKVLRDNANDINDVIEQCQGIQLNLIQFKVLYSNLRYIDWVIKCCLGDIPVGSTTLGEDEQYLKKTFRFY